MRGMERESIPLKHKCPYKAKDGTCKKGWAMIALISEDGILTYICPKCEKDLLQANEDLLQ